MNKMFNFTLPGWFKHKDGHGVDVEVSVFKGDPEIHTNPYVIDEVFVENVAIGDHLTDKTLTDMENEVNNIINLTCKKVG